MSDKKLSIMELRKINHSKIFQYIYKRKPQSKLEIAYALQMSIPTVAQNIRDLQEQGLIKDAGMFESTGGRKAQAIVFNPKAHFSIGLDVTRHHVGLVMVDLGGEVLKSVRVQCPFRKTKTYFQKLGTLIEGTITELEIDRKKILGVSIAVPAIVSEDQQHMTYSSALGMSKGELRYFSEYIAYPSILCNDANAAGLAETWNKGSMDNMIYLSLNNSVGGCIYLNGRMSYGSNQRGGEFGHMTIVPNGKICYCGQRGCLDAYCNAKILSDSTSGDMDKFFSKIHEGSAEHVIIWNKYLENLTIGLNNLYMAFDYDIVIGGYVGAYMDRYIDRLREMVAAKNTFQRDGSYLKVCSYKSEATAVGAALHYIDSFIKSV